MAKEHIYLGNDFAETISFTPKPRPNTTPLPSRDVAQHASMLRKMYRESIISAREKIFARKDAHLPSADGVYLDIDLKGERLPLDNLDKSGSHLLTVGNIQDNDITTATIFLPFENEEWLDKKLDKYERPVAEGKKPAFQPLINAVETITQSEVRSLFPNKQEYDELFPNTFRLFEIWIDEVDPNKLDKIRTDMERMGLSIVGNNIITFESVTIILVRALKEAIDDIPYALDVVEAVKLYHNPAEMVDRDEDQRDWTQRRLLRCGLLLSWHL